MGIAGHQDSPLGVYFILFYYRAGETLFACLGGQSIVQHGALRAREAVRKWSAGVPPAGKTGCTFVTGERDARAPSGRVSRFFHNFRRRRYKTKDMLPALSESFSLAFEPCVTVHSRMDGKTIQSLSE